MLSRPGVADILDELLRILDLEEIDFNIFRGENEPSRHGRRCGKLAPMLRILLILVFFSGAAGLLYEIVWTRMFAIGLGHEMPSLLAVVAAFFSGLAIGALALDGRISRSRRPARSPCVTLN